MKFFILKVKKYIYILITSFQNQLVYKTDLIAQNVFFALLIFIFINLWSKVFSSKNDFYGYTKNDLIWYFIITEIITLTTQKFVFQISQQIKDGSFAYVLNKPYEFLLYIIADNAGVMFYKLITNSVIGILMGIVFVGPLNLQFMIHLPLLLISIFLGIFIHYYFQTCIALSVLFIEDNSAFFWIYFKMTMIFGIMIPIDIFPAWIFNIIKYLPFAFITYAPAKLFLNFSYDFYINTLFFQLIYLAAGVMASILLFRKGVKHVSIQGG
jgi:ABC-2 type transport system permease protein